MPNGKKKKGHKMATHKRKKRLRKNRHKSKKVLELRLSTTPSKWQDERKWRECADAL